MKSKHARVHKHTCPRRYCGTYMLCIREYVADPVGGALSKGESVNAFTRAKVKIWGSAGRGTSERYVLHVLRLPSVPGVRRAGKSRPAPVSRLRPGSRYHLGHSVQLGPAKPGKRAARCWCTPPPPRWFIHPAHSLSLSLSVSHAYLSRRMCVAHEPKETPLHVGVCVRDTCVARLAGSPAGLLFIHAAVRALRVISQATTLRKMYAGTPPLLSSVTR